MTLTIETYLEQIKKSAPDFLIDGLLHDLNAYTNSVVSTLEMLNAPSEDELSNNDKRTILDIALQSARNIQVILAAVREYQRLNS